MAWLSTYDDTNLIQDEITSQTEYISFTVSAEEEPVDYSRNVTTSKYRYVGMTYATAVTCQGALNAPPNTVATLRRENDAGAYMVEVTQVTRSAWALVTTTTTTTTT